MTMPPTPETFRTVTSCFADETPFLAALLFPHDLSETCYRRSGAPCLAGRDDQSRPRSPWACREQRSPSHGVLRSPDAFLCDSHGLAGLLARRALWRERHETRFPALVAHREYRDP